MLKDELLKLESEKNQIRVGVCGAGWMGSGFVTQVSLMPGIEVVVLADSNIKAAADTFLSVGVDKKDIIEANTPGSAMDALRTGKRVITGSYKLPAQIEAVDIVTDVTPSPVIGVETALACIQYKKDVVMVNIEADVTVGRILNNMAQKAGILYSVSSGDEPGCLMEIYDYVCSLGFEPIVIGKGKNNPLDPKATPDTVSQVALKANKDPYQTASYVDGTKTMIEMTCAANATGCPPICRSMIGPEANLQTVSGIFALKEDGGITPFPGVVDFVQGTQMAGGVFVTARVENSRIRADLEYLKVGKGFYYTFFRPYHLWFIEAPLSIAHAHLHRQKTLVQKEKPVAEVMTVSKRALKPGEKLDNFGGYTFYGVIDRAEEAMALNALPVGLAPGAEITRPVEADQVVTRNDVKLDEESDIVKLRRLQDEL